LRDLAWMALLMPALQSTASAQMPSSPNAAAPRNFQAKPEALPIITVQAPRRTPKLRQSLQHDAPGLRSSKPAVASGRSTQPATSASGAANVAAGGSADAGGYILAQPGAAT
jgi:hypothetical protein